METCFFCETRPADPPSAVEVQLRGEKLGTRKTGFKQYTTTYEGRRVPVPRCSACAEIHRKQRRSAGTSTVLGTVGVLVILGGFYMGGWAKSR